MTVSETRMGRARYTEFMTLPANATGLAVDAADRILYNTTTGQLSYDADGSESDAAVEFAVLQNLATLDASDFFVF